MALQWDRPGEKQKLLQLVASACRSAHGIDLRLSLVVRVPFGLQGLHQHIAQSRKTMLLTECTVHPEVCRLWIESIRVVQTQGRSVGSVLGSFREWCKQLDCSPEADDTVSPYTPRHGLDLPQDASGFVGFRVDDQRLPDWIRKVTQLHGRFIPAQHTNPAAAVELAQQLCDLRRKVGLPEAPLHTFQPWLESLLGAQPVEQRHPGSLPFADALDVCGVLTGLTGHLVGVPINKNRILYFEDAVQYRQRLISVFLRDTRHYTATDVPAEQLLQTCVADCKRLHWDKLCTPSVKSTWVMHSACPRTRTVR